MSPFFGTDHHRRQIRPENSAAYDGPLPPSQDNFVTEADDPFITETGDNFVTEIC